MLTSDTAHFYASSQCVYLSVCLSVSLSVSVSLSIYIYNMSKRQREKANKECVESLNQYSSFQFQNTLSKDTTLLNILKSLFADNTEEKQPIDLEA